MNLRMRDNSGERYGFEGSKRGGGICDLGVPGKWQFIEEGFHASTEDWFSIEFYHSQEIGGMWQKIGGNLIFTFIVMDFFFQRSFFPTVSKSRPIVTNSECKEQWCTPRFFDWGLIVITVIRYFTEAAKFFFLKKKVTQPSQLAWVWWCKSKIAEPTPESISCNGRSAIWYLPIPICH